MKRITSLGITCAVSLWYPVMLAQQTGNISESKAAELLGVGLEKYHRVKHQAILAIMDLIEDLPSPIVSLWQVIKDKPEIFND